MPRPRNANGAPRRGRNDAGVSKPNMPTAQLCGTCDTDVGDSAIGCDECETWVHDSEMCSGLPQDMIDAIARHNGEGIKFVCTKCRIKSSSTRPSSQSGRSDSQVVELVAQLFQQLRGLCGSVQYLLELSKSRPSVPLDPPRVVNPELANTTANIHLSPQAAPGNTSLVAPMVSPHTQTSDSYRQIVREELRELDEQRKRRNSLVVRGLAASNAEEAAHRFEVISEYLTGRKVGLTDVVKIQGESDLFRGKINDDEVRKSVLDKAKQLKNSEQFHTIFIRRDLTYNQRQLLKARQAVARDPVSGPPRPSRTYSRRNPSELVTAQSTTSPTDNTTAAHAESNTASPLHPTAAEETVPKSVFPGQALASNQ